MFSLLWSGFMICWLILKYVFLAPVDVEIIFGAEITSPGYTHFQNLSQLQEKELFLWKWGPTVQLAWDTFAFQRLDMSSIKKIFFHGSWGSRTSKCPPSVKTGGGLLLLSISSLPSSDRRTLPPTKDFFGNKETRPYLRNQAGTTIFCDSP